MPTKFVKMKKYRDDHPEDADPGAAKIIHDGDKIIYDYSHVVNAEPKLIKMKRSADQKTEREARKEQRETRKREKLAIKSSTAALGQSREDQGLLYRGIVSAVDGFFSLFGLKSTAERNLGGSEAKPKLSKEAKREKRESRRKTPVVTPQATRESVNQPAEPEKEVDETQRTM